MAERNYWFGHKWLGAGLAPASWQGWLCLLAYVVALGWSLRQGPVYLADNRMIVGLVALETVLFFGIVWMKRDRNRSVRWRWFGRD